jgi:RNA polymerase sigma-70 factor, ECF subfamily
MAMHHEPLPNLRDSEGFSAVYRRLRPAAHAAALAVLRDREAAQDVVQDVFCALWTRPDAYRPERGSLTTFVQVMARSRALDRLRSRAAATAAVTRDAAEARVRPAHAEPPCETVIRRDSARAVLRALDRLPDGQRAAVLLHHVGGLSDGELARATQVPLGTAKSRIRLGTRRARDVVEARFAA